MKKLVTLLLAMVMIFSLATTAAAASITITPPETTNGTETGITYTAYKIFDATIDGTKVAYTIKSDSPYFETVKNSGYFTLTATVNDATTYVVVPNETYTESVADTFADTLKAVAADAEGTLTKQADGNYKLEGLENGYYLVTSSVGSDLILDTIGDITVKTKNEYPGQDKKVEGKDSTTADMGEILNFTIDVTIPEDAVGEIVVHDKMTGLEYVDMTAVSGITVATTDLGDDCAVHFTLTADYVAANKDKTVTIAYTAKVTADVANNEAWLVDGSYTTKPSETDVYSTDIVINKVDGSDKTTPLAGAEFALYKLEGETKLYYKYDEATKTVSWENNIDAATKVETDNKGAAEFTDIADGTYYLVETKAPTGYNKLTEAKEVIVTSNGGTTTDVTITVENKAGTELPSTGGVGTTMFYVIGGLMMLMAVVLLVTKKRMASAE